MHFVLVARKDVLADDLRCFEVATAMPAAGNVGVSRPVVDRSLRIGAQRPLARRYVAAGCEQRVWRLAVLDPVHQRTERIDWNRTAVGVGSDRYSDSAMP